MELLIFPAKFNKNKRPLDLGLGRKGAVRARKEEVHEMYGHRFVQQQFYNIMRCALCSDFLKYSAGMQCSDCKYTCHKKCYTKVVTKCMSKSNAESDPEEEKLNHRIPHRFEAMTNMGANWCCHCGYMLPVGKKNARRCTGSLYSNDTKDVLEANFGKNAPSHATPSARIWSLISAECLWKLQTKFLER